MSKFPEDDAELVEQSFARHIARNQDELGYLSECFLNWFYCVNSCIVIASVELAVPSFDSTRGKKLHSRIGGPLLE
jgi:hypothetical protein